MPRCLVAALAILLLPGLAVAACDGRNLLDEMPAAERAVLDAAAAAQPFAEGNYWRASREGSIIDVIGTMHVHDPRMAGAMARLLPVIAEAQAIYLEATTAEIAALEKAVVSQPDLLFSGAGPTLPEQLDEADWQMLAQAMSERGIPPFLAAKFRPWYVSVLLSIPPCAVADATSGGLGLDRLIMDAAAASKVPTLPLEPWDTLFTVFAGMDARQQLDMVRAVLPQMDQADDMFATMLDSYFAEKHRLLWELSRAQSLEVPAAEADRAAADFAEMEAALLTGRNRAWMKVILPAAAGRHIVVAVGAAHLSGEEGVLRLLEKAGYQIRRQPF